MLPPRLSFKFTEVNGKNQQHWIKQDSAHMVTLLEAGGWKIFEDFVSLREPLGISKNHSNSSCVHWAPLRNIFHKFPNCELTNFSVMSQSSMSLLWVSTPWQTPHPGQCWNTETVAQTQKPGGKAEIQNPGTGLKCTPMALPRVLRRAPHSFLQLCPLWKGNVNI